MQPVQHVHSGKTGADHDDIVGLSACGVAFAGNGWQGGHLFALPWDSSCIADQHSIRRVKAQGAKPLLWAAIFCRAECVAPHGEEAHLRRLEP
jgi:hypothetical protein